LINENIAAHDWNIIDNLNCDESCKHFLITTEAIVNKIAPIKERKIKHNTQINPEWVTKGITNSSNKLRKMYKSSIGLDPLNHKVIKYKKYRQTLNMIKRKAKQLHLAKLFQDCSHDMKKTWRELNKLIGKTSNKHNLTDQFMLDNKILLNPIEIANSFCDFFSKVGSNTADNIPSTNMDVYETPATPSTCDL